MGTDTFLCAAHLPDELRRIVGTNGGELGNVEADAQSLRGREEDGAGFFGHRNVPGTLPPTAIQRTARVINCSGFRGPSDPRARDSTRGTAPHCCVAVAGGNPRLRPSRAFCPPCGLVRADHPLDCAAARRNPGQAQISKQGQGPGQQNRSRHQDYARRTPTPGLVAGGRVAAVIAMGLEAHNRQ